MKRVMLILGMLLMVTTSYNQTSRRSSGSTPSTDRNSSKAPAPRSSRSTTSTSESRSRETTKPATSSQSTRTTTHTTPSSSTKPNSTSRSQATTHTATRRTTNTHVVEYKSPRVNRTPHRVRHHYQTPPSSRDYRRVHHVYRSPVSIDFCWTPEIHRNFIHIYPMVHRWEYRSGARFEVISAYDAMYYRGDVATVYGQVTEVIYSRATDEYFLYFGPYYPYHDFTVVMPGYMARSYNRNPSHYFEQQYLAVSGLITSYEGEPEIYVKEQFQINFY